MGVRGKQGRKKDKFQGVTPKKTHRTQHFDTAQEAAIALARLPLTIRGFGPVKEANEREASKRREELLSVIRQGGAPLTQAAE